MAHCTGTPRPCGARVPRPGFRSDIPQTWHRNALEGHQGATSALEVSGRPHMPERLQGRPNGPGGLARVSLDKSDVGALCVGPPLRGRAPLLAHRKPTESNAT